MIYLGFSAAVHVHPNMMQQHRQSLLAHAHPPVPALPRVPQAQALAAEVLAAIAALPRIKEAALAALSDHALPRACEVVRSLQPDSPGAPVSSPQDGSGAAPAQQAQQQSPREEAEQAGARSLLGACAAIVARLAQGSEPCARVVVYHTKSLRVTVAALVITRQCGLAQALLQTSLRLAAGHGCDAAAEE